MLALAEGRELRDGRRRALARRERLERDHGAHVRLCHVLVRRELRDGRRAARRPEIVKRVRHGHGNLGRRRCRGRGHGRLRRAAALERGRRVVVVRVRERLRGVAVRTGAAPSVRVAVVVRVVADGGLVHAL